MASISRRKNDSGGERGDEQQTRDNSRKIVLQPTSHGSPTAWAFMLELRPNRIAGLGNFVGLVHDDLLRERVDRLLKCSGAVVLLHNSVRS
jgi:hypothetical protein